MNAAEQNLQFLQYNILNSHRFLLHCKTLNWIAVRSFVAVNQEQMPTFSIQGFVWARYNVVGAYMIKSNAYIGKNTHWLSDFDSKKFVVHWIEPSLAQSMMLWALSLKQIIVFQKMSRTGQSNRFDSELAANQSGSCKAASIQFAAKREAGSC